MVSWGVHPRFKLEAGSVDFSYDGLTLEHHRPENAISQALISASDYQGKNYIGNVDIGSTIKVSLRYGSDSWKQVFEGVAERVGPSVNTQQTVELSAYGYGRALRNTHCVSSYGTESENPTIDTPHKIWDDIIAEMVNKSFGGAATGYAILDTKVAPCANPSIKFLEGAYKNNLGMINDVLKIYQGYRNGLAGMHWFVDENKALFINTIAAHENNGTGWPTWYNVDQAGSTLVEGVDFISYFFNKRMTPGNFANKIVLYCNLRKPGTDIWTENAGPTWSDVNMKAPTPDYSAVQNIVGSHSLRMIVETATTAYAWHPNFNAAWDLTKVGSSESIPSINFYFYKDVWVNELTSKLRLCTTDQTNDYYEVAFSDWTDLDNTWVHVSIPIGANWKTKDEGRIFRWTKVGNADWADINGVCWKLEANAEQDATLYIDDLHFSGKIIREAYNSTNITANKEVQKPLRYDTAVDDSLTASDDTGTAGHLAYGELLTRQTIPIVGTIVTPLAIDVLPGQLVHIHADKQSSGAFRVDADFRVKEPIHRASKALGFNTTWDLTSDVLNTFGVGFNDALTALYKVVHTDPEMMNLKTTGLDPYVQRLSKDYP